MGWRRLPRKSTAAAKEAKEAKEAAKATPGWATTFTLDGVQYVLKDAAGHPVGSSFIRFTSYDSFSDCREQVFHGPCSWYSFQRGAP